MIELRDIPGQDTAKRALEIAATGGLSIRLVGCPETAARLAAALPAIGGRVEQAQAHGLIVVELDAPSAAERLRMRPADALTGYSAAQPATEPTAAGLQYVMPGCDKDFSRTPAGKPVQLSLF